MGNKKALAIAATLGLGLIFSSPFAARAESQAGGLPALENRVEADEALITELETDVTDLEALVATALHRLSAEFQNGATSEISTTAGPGVAGAGGILVYDKTLTIPFPVAYITFSAQGDTHGGTALLMTASVTNADGTTTTCQPMANAAGAAKVQAPWMTLMKLPTNPTVDAGGLTGNAGVNNCTQAAGVNGDGAGGSADCHDNAFSFSCCVLTTPATISPNTNQQDVKIKLASSNGTGAVFYEDSTIYIDASSNASLCTGVDTAAH
jgi:hypothetical protein